MTVTSRRIIAGLLLASYGLVSACGAGLHALVDDSHTGAATTCSNEGGHSSPSSPASDHSDCLICHVAGQGQLLDNPGPICSGSVGVGEVIPTEPVAHRPPDRLPGDPRAPPGAFA